MQERVYKLIICLLIFVTYPAEMQNIIVETAGWEVNL